MTLAAAEKTIAMPIAKPCFGLGFKEEPLPFGDLRSEMLYELILCCICGGMSPLSAASTTRPDQPGLRR